MKKHLMALALLSFVLLATWPALAQEKPGMKEEDPAHNELRALRDGLTDAVLKGDVEKQLNYVSKDVVVTWQNGQVVRGHDGLKDFFKKNQGGTAKVFQGYKVPPTPEDLTVLYGGNTGISYGKSVGKYNVLGKEFELENHWSATLVKDAGGHWLIASYHVSGDILDNPLLNTAKNTLYLAGGVALLLGLAGGIILGRLVRRSRT